MEKTETLKLDGEAAIDGHARIEAARTTAAAWCFCVFCVCLTVLICVAIGVSSG